jgi:tape measure domain-containing protein
MAGSDRDINLVIRAKNDATKAIDSVSEALKQLAGIQNDVGQSADKADGLLGELTQSLTNLIRQAQGLAALGTVAGQLDRAAAAVDRLENSARAAGDAATPLVEKYEAAAAATAQLSERAEQAKTAIEAQTAATAEAKTANSALAEELKKAEASYRGIYEQVAKAKAPSDALKTSLNEQGNALQTLVERQEQAQAAYNAQREALTAAKSDYKLLDTQVTAAAGAQTKLETESTKATAAVGRAEATLAKAREELGLIAQLGGQASAALGNVALSQEALSKASLDTAANLAAVKAAADRQSAAGVATGGAPTTGASAAATAAYRAQVQAVREAQAAWTAAKASATALGAEMARTGEPTLQLKTDFLVTREAAESARQAYLDQAEALNQVRGVTQGSISSFLQLAQAMESEQHAAAVAGTALRDIPPIAPRIEEDTFSLRAFLAALFQVPQAAGAAEAGVTKFGSAGHESFSITQRMRSEIVGLATAYVGFYGVISQIIGVVATLRSVESAQARLGVVFEGDQAAAGQEIGFVYAQAQRLGIEFSVLAGEYTKVAIAAKEANFSTDATRKIFLAFAEASRVAGLSTSDIESAFLGLRQSIERGTINARNFNLEIGSRVPGAMQAMAAALGVTVPKLTQLEKAGGMVAASQETLVRFADNLAARYAGALPDALKQTNAEIGRFQTNLQGAQLQVANGGFADALKDALVSLDKEFQSDNGAKFFGEVGHGLGLIVGVIPVVVQNFGLLVSAGRAFVALKIAEYVIGLVGGQGKFSVAMKAAALDVDRMTAALAAMSLEKTASEFGTLRLQVAVAAASLSTMKVEAIAAAAGTAVLDGALVAMRGVMISLTAVAKTLWVAVGGFPGLILTAATFILSGLLGDWIGGVGQANEALTTHEEIVRKIRAAYDDVGTSVDKIKDKLKEVSSIQAEINAQAIGQQLLDLRSKTKGPSLGPSDGEAVNFSKSEAAVDKAVVAFKAGAISATNFKTQINAIAEADPQLDRKLVKQLLDSADSAHKLETGLIEANAVVDMLKGTATDAEKALLGLGKAAATAFATSPLEAYTKALKEMQAEIPELAKAMKAQDAVKKLDDELRAGQLDLQGDLNSKDPATKAKAQAQSDTLANAHAAAVSQALGAANADNALTGGRSGDLLSSAAKFRGDTANGSSDVLETLFKKANINLDPTQTAWCAAFVSAILASNSLPVPTKNPTAARSFLNYGSEVTPEKAEKGDIVILKGAAGASSGHVGFFDGYSADGSHVNVLGGNQGQAGGGAVKDSSFPTSSLLGIRRAPTAPEQAKQADEDQDRIDKFKQSITDLVNGLLADASAIEVSAKQAFINSKLEQAQKDAETASRPGKPVTLSDADKANVASAAGTEFDAKANADAGKQVAALQLQINAKLKGDVEDLTRDEYALNEAKKAGVDIATQNGQKYIELAGQLFDMTARQKAFNSVIGLSQQAKSLQGQVGQAFKQGDGQGAAELQTQLNAVLADLKAALPAAKAFADAMGDQKLTAQLDKVNAQLLTMKVNLTDAKEINGLLANGLGGAFDKVAESLGKFASGFGQLKNVVADARTALLQFAGDFLKQIAEMIIKQQLLMLLQKSPIGGAISGAVNSLTGAAGSAGLLTAGTTLNTAGALLTSASVAWEATSATILGAASVLSGASGLQIVAATDEEAAASAQEMAELVGLFHGGGVVGSVGGMTRNVSPSIFNGANRYHTGGFAGLAAGEVPAILQKNEEILTTANPRHAFNQGQTGSGSSQPTHSPVKIVNAFSPGDVLAASLETEVGQKSILNHVRSNRGAWQSAMGNGGRS